MIGDMDWMDLLQVLVKMIINLRVPCKDGNFLING